MSKRYTLGDLSFLFQIGEYVKHRADSQVIPIKLIIMGRAQMEQDGGLIENIYLVSYVKPKSDALGQFGRHYLSEMELEKYKVDYDLD